MDKSKNIKSLINKASEITGPIGGTLLALVVGGTEGAITGSVYGALLTSTLKDIGKNLLSNHFGKREEIKVGAAYYLAISKIDEKIRAGEEYRKDGFFEKQGDNRSKASEILEGLLINAKNEHEEKKLKLLGNLYANLCFTDKYDGYWGNYLIHLSKELSYRQFCLIYIYNNSHLFNIHEKIKGAYEARMVVRKDALNEIYDLKEKSLLNILVTNTPDFADPSWIKISEFGKMIYGMFNLEELDKKDVLEVFSPFNPNFENTPFFKDNF